VPAESGQRCALTLPNDHTVPVRVAEISERRTRLQLPMDRATLDAMERYIVSVVDAYRREVDVTLDGTDMSPAQAA